MYVRGYVLWRVVQRVSVSVHMRGVLSAPPRAQGPPLCPPPGGRPLPGEGFWGAPARLTGACGGRVPPPKGAGWVQGRWRGLGRETGDSQACGGKVGRLGADTRTHAHGRVQAHTCTPAHTVAQAQAYTCTTACPHAHRHRHAQAQAHTCTPACMGAQAQAHTRTPVCTRAQARGAPRHRCTHAHQHSQAGTQAWHAQAQAQAHTCTPAHTGAQAQASTGMGTHMHTSTHGHTGTAHTGTGTHTHTSTHRHGHAQAHQHSRMRAQAQARTHRACSTELWPPLLSVGTAFASCHLSSCTFPPKWLRPTRRGT